MDSKKLTLGLVTVLGIILVIILWDAAQNTKESETKQVFVDGEGQLVKQPTNTKDVARAIVTIIDPNNPISAAEGDTVTTKTLITTKDIMVTDGVQHSVPLDDIRGGGPPRDGIPSIDDPKFTSIRDAEKNLTDNEPGIVVSMDGVHRFYPYQILVWHEIVNDTINGKRILVTYCPLCLSGIVFDPLVDGELVEFGTSGKLWQSNLVMYDRKTETYWSQVLGEAILGQQTGAMLNVIPSDITTFGAFKKLHKNGEVLSRDTGTIRSYGRDPYGDYYTSSGTYFPVRATDNRLAEKDFVLGIVVNGKAKAYYPPSIKEKGKVTDTFEGKTIVLQYIESIDAVRMFEETADGNMIRINPFPNFWFSWVAAHPETALYK